MGLGLDMMLDRVYVDKNRGWDVMLAKIYVNKNRGVKETSFF